RFLGAADFLAAPPFLLGGFLLLALLAAARFLQRGHARFLGLAQQFRLKLVTGKEIVARRRAWRARRGGGRALLRRRRRDGLGSGRFARRWRLSLAGLA